MEKEWQKREQSLLPLFRGVDDPGFDAAAVALVGGLDVSFDKLDPNKAVGTLVVCTMPDLHVVHEVTQTFLLSTPYIPGFLAARETEPMVQLYNSLLERGGPVPDVVLVDGNGVYHPRRCGSATCFGILANTPAIGVAKKPFEIEGITRAPSGCASMPLTSSVTGEVLGVALCAGRKSSKPIYVSQGHRIGLASAEAVVRACCTHRIPEPIRQADLRSRRHCS